MSLTSFLGRQVKLPTCGYMEQGLVNLKMKEQGEQKEKVLPIPSTFKMTSTSLSTLDLFPH